MQTISFLFLSFFFAIGLVIGSFLNCLIYRVKIKRSFLSGRSYCPKCKHKLSWFDLIPVLSYLQLAGKCRYCQKSISFQYPLVEIAIGILYAAAAAILEPSIVFLASFTLFNLFSLFYYWFIISVLVVVFVYDLLWYIIPDEAVFAGILATAAFCASRFFYEFFLTGSANFEILANPLLASVFAFSFFLTVFLVSSGKWMGFGDVKYAALMGMVLGFPDIAVGLFLSFFLGAIIGLSLIGLKKKEISSEIPFGPFLVSGTIAALFFGKDIIFIYLGI
jgi:prepilin signal peptidase PulO-like enzyme (type II secretory pathway)